MLGKLTRFLRIFGFDAVYANDLIDYFKIDPVPDEKLIEFAKQNDRVIITKDYLLYKNNRSKTILLEGEGIYNYLSQLNNNGLEFIFNIEKARCSMCNSELKKVNEKDLIKDLILEETFNHYNEFFQCINPQCKKVYWKGSHIEDIINKIEDKLELNS